MSNISKEKADLKACGIIPEQNCKEHPVPSILEVLRSNINKLEVCLICGEPVPDNAITFCYDPLWERNCWGGDTHEMLGNLHEECVEKQLKKYLK